MLIRSIRRLLKLAVLVLVFVVGMTVVAIGVALIALPGPAFIVIPAGLAILGTEFLWARRLLKKMRDSAKIVVGLNKDEPRWARRLLEKVWDSAKTLVGMNKDERRS